MLGAFLFLQGLIFSKMMKKLTWLTLFCSLFMLSSCFELLEDLSLNKDGSGDLKVKLNMSASAAKLKGVMALDSLDGKKVPSQEDILDTLNKYVNLLNDQPGLSSANASMDFEYFILNFSVHFDSLSALENAVQKLSKKEGDYNWVSFDGRVLERKGLSILEPVLNKIKQKDRERLNEATYISITRFNQEIQKVSNSNAKVAKNKKAVMQRFGVLEVLEDPEVLGVRVEVE